MNLSFAAKGEEAMRTKQGKIRAFALTGLSVILVLGATHSTANAQGGDSYYNIRNKNSELYLQVEGEGTHHGANVVQANFEDRDDFKWSLELEKGDYYNIRNKNSELYLQVFDKQTHHGANVIQANLEDRDDFKWNLRLASGESPDYNCRFADFHGGLKESDANRV
jgi:DNA-binding helix-hairpin-helix protein with protein kinase domain